MGIEESEEDKILSFFLSNEDSMHKIGLELAKNSNIKPFTIISAIIDTTIGYNVMVGEHVSIFRFTKVFCNIRITIKDAPFAGLFFPSFRQPVFEIHELNSKGLVIKNLLSTKIEFDEFNRFKDRYDYIFTRIYKILR